LHSVNPEVCEW